MLVVLSLLLHVLLLGTVGRRLIRPPEQRLPVPPGALAVRLQAVSAHTVPAPAPDPAPAPALPTRHAVAPAPAATPAQTVEPLHAAPPAPLTSVPDTVAPGVPRPTPGPDHGAESPATVQAPIPGRYRARMPPSATVVYQVLESDGTQRAVQIAWQTQDGRFTIAADGVLGALTSMGASTDNGVAPEAATLRTAYGAAIDATFTPAAMTIAGRAYPSRNGSQDPASLLLQLVGMGLAAPGQFESDIVIGVASADGPVTMEFEVAGDDTLATPLGALVTRHLVQRVLRDQPRLEIWLAPERRWLPVQLRVTEPNGQVRTQTVTRIDEP